MELDLGQVKLDELFKDMARHSLIPNRHFL